MLHEKRESSRTSVSCKAAVSTDNCFVAGKTDNLSVSGALVVIEEGSPNESMLNANAELWLDLQGRELELPCRIVRVGATEVAVEFTNIDIDTMMMLKKILS